MHFDETFLVFTSLVAFILLLIYLRVPAKVLYFLDARADRIRDELFEARRLREEAENVLVQYKEKYSKIGTDVREIIVVAEQKAKLIKDDNCKNIEKLSDLHLENVKRTIHCMELEAKRLFYIKLAYFSIEYAKEIISQKIDDDISCHIFQDAIREIEQYKN
ncbi:F0F1 ATP synthase subunit B [Candidatus Liberibacter solanacearum CLso-ZC1]|uniref:ATP synthase F(0) sector subunit b 2 n=1 Tax=Liberibacter solanacearum (strain CLso-ZC1) TaxID=658172 RepID=E4UBD1_LIBSC|nr:F0F1 ATP synthase subunit B [Candidatus Liberibacter solanacearum]ADR52436.1 F0F1 ATP synthase subunit B [Candidatus Liberibacter solanacearum CLso-ZC1]